MGHAFKRQRLIDTHILVPAQMKPKFYTTDMRQRL